MMDRFAHISDNEFWRVCLHEISMEGMTLCVWTIRQELIRDSHSIQMYNHHVLKGKSISRQMDGAKPGDKNFNFIITYRGQKLCFIDLLNLESSNRSTATQLVTRRLVILPPQDPL
jgi:hypothetical protein